jgi:beta-xylosidase
LIEVVSARARDVRWLLSGVAAAILLVTPPARASDPALFVAPARKIVMSEFLGLNTPFLFFPPFAYQRQIAAERALGLKWARLDLHWAVIEKMQGVPDLAVVDDVLKSMKDGGLEPLVYVVGTPPFASSAPPGPNPPHDNWGPKDNAQYADFVEKLAKRYPDVKYWQIWNEPNLPSFWALKEDPAAFATLAKDAAEILHRDIPDRKLVLAGMANYSQMPLRGGFMLEDLLKAGVQRDYDVMAYHPYTDTPEGDSPGDAQGFIKEVPNVNRTLRNAGVRAIWATEFGWSTYTGEKVQQPIISETTQADYILRRIALMMRQDFDRVFYFALTDLDFRVQRREQHYGLLDVQGNPKPAYTALKYFLATTGDELSAAPDLVTPNLASKLYAFTWQRADGKRLVFLWAAEPQSVALDCCATALLHDPLTQTHQQLTAQDGKIEVPVTPSLQILEVP